jgi:hypothetical protein
MLVVVLLLPLSSSMYDGEFDHGYGASLGGSLCDTHNPTLGLFSRTFLHTMSS